MCSLKYVCVPFSIPCSMPKLWGGGVPTSDIGYSSPSLLVPDAHYIRLKTRYTCQWQDIISYTDYSTTDMHTTYNEHSTDNWVTESSRLGTLSYLVCDMRDIVLPWNNTLRIDHYPVALDCTTTRGPDMYISPIWNFLRLSEAQVWTELPIIKDIQISDQTLIPCWDAVCNLGI